MLARFRLEQLAGYQAGLAALAGEGQVQSTAWESRCRCGLPPRERASGGPLGRLVGLYTRFRCGRLTDRVADRGPGSRPVPYEMTTRTVVVGSSEGLPVIDRRDTAGPAGTGPPELGREELRPRSVVRPPGTGIHVACCGAGGNSGDAPSTRPCRHHNRRGSNGDGIPRRGAARPCPDLTPGAGRGG